MTTMAVALDRNLFLAYYSSKPLQLTLQLKTITLHNALDCLKDIYILAINYKRGVSSILTESGLYRYILM